MARASRLRWSAAQGARRRWRHLRRQQNWVGLAAAPATPAASHGGGFMMCMARCGVVVLDTRSRRVLARSFGGELGGDGGGGCIMNGYRQGRTTKRDEREHGPMRDHVRTAGFDRYSLVPTSLPRPDPHQQHIYRALVGTLVCEMMQHRAARLGQRAFSAVETVMRHPQQSSRKAMFQVATRSIAL